MHRFLALLWDGHERRAARQADAWSRALECGPRRWDRYLDAPGLRVLGPAKASGPRHFPVKDGDEGLVIGAMFERGRETDGRITRLAPGSLARCGSEGLIARFWGNYIAIWRNAGSKAVTILRDPCGAIACFHVRSGGVDLLCSSPAEIAHLPGLKLTIDWTSLDVFLAYPPIVTRHTCLDELSELLPGEEAIWRPCATLERRWAWDIAHKARASDRPTFSEACLELRATAKTSLGAWKRSFDHILVRVSGGLDSSIVASLLARDPAARITGLHVTGRGYEAHELALARLTARNAGIKLVELESGSRQSRFGAPLSAPLLARPTMQMLGAGLEQALVALYATIGADGVMSGHGGDNLFLQRSLATHVFVDGLSVNSPFRNAPGFAYDVAMLQERSIWGVLGAAGRTLFTRYLSPATCDLGPAAPASNALLSDERRRAIAPERTLHPLEASLQDLPPCKKEQAHAILALRDYHPLISSEAAPPSVFPLISQPILEFALRTPAPTFVQGGLDRALERSAFADLIPLQVARRTEKGFINHHLTSDVLEHLTGIRERLLDSELVRRGGLERARIERLLTPEGLHRPGSLNAALKLIVADAWLCAWRAAGV